MVDRDVSIEELSVYTCSCCLGGERTVFPLSSSYVFNKLSIYTHSALLATRMWSTSYWYCRDRDFGD